MLEVAQENHISNYCSLIGPMDHVETSISYFGVLGRRNIVEIEKGVSAACVVAAKRLFVKG